MELKRNIMSRKSVRRLLSKSSLSLQMFSDNSFIQKNQSFGTEHPVIKVGKMFYNKSTGCLNTKCVFYFDYRNDTISN